MNSIPSIEMRTQKVKQLAESVGFDLVGIAKCVPLDSEVEFLKKWIDERKHASMEWMTKNIDRRSDPRLILEGCQSIIALAVNYQPHPEIDTEEKLTNSGEDFGKISSYAVHKDYHHTMKSMMKEYSRDLKKSISEDIRLRWYVDTGPVMEKAWAQRAGLGFIGKNTCLINRKKGSWIFLGVILTDLELIYDQAVTQNWCGECSACIEACPTNALDTAGVLDSNKCISYLTIEHREEVDIELKADFEGWLFGCDICQSVCPFNIKFAKPPIVPAFERIMPNSVSLDDILDINSEEEFRTRFKSKNPLRRAGLTGLSRTAKILKDNNR